MYVDVADHLAGKLAALACHRSQVEQSAVVEPDVVAAQARYWGARARITYAEAFTPTRLVWDLAPVRPVEPAGRLNGSAQAGVGTHAEADARRHRHTLPAPAR